MVVDFSIMPVGKGESLSGHVAEAIKLVVESGLPVNVGPMATTVEGEWDEVMDLIKNCRNKLLETVDRVYLVIKVDDRKGHKGCITGKIESIEEKLGRSLR